MIVIEDKGKLKFYEGKTELTMKEGFARLNQIYGTEPQETKRIIDRLKQKYGKVQPTAKPFLFAFVECGRQPMSVQGRLRAE